MHVSYLWEVIHQYNEKCPFKRMFENASISSVGHFLIILRNNSKFKIMNISSRKLVQLFFMLRFTSIKTLSYRITKWRPFIIFRKF